MVLFSYRAYVRLHKGEGHHDMAGQPQDEAGHQEVQVTTHSVDGNTEQWHRNRSNHVYHAA